MRRPVLRLGKERQITARQLAGRIAENVDGVATIHTHDTSNYERADIVDRLGQIFSIRFRLYQLKFVVKFVNNLLAQMTLEEIRNFRKLGAKTGVEGVVALEYKVLHKTLGTRPLGEVGPEVRAGLREFVEGELERRAVTVEELEEGVGLSARGRATSTAA